MDEDWTIIVKKSYWHKKRGLAISGDLTGTPTKGSSALKLMAMNVWLPIDITKIELIDDIYVYYIDGYIAKSMPEESIIKNEKFQKTGFIWENIKGCRKCE